MLKSDWPWWNLVKDFEFGKANDCQANNKSYQFDNWVFEIPLQCKKCNGYPFSQKE